VEGVGLATGAVEGEHQLAAQALAERVLGDELLQLGNDLILVARREVGSEPLLEYGKLQLLKPSYLGPGERLVSKVRKRIPTPDRERGPETSSALTRIGLSPRIRDADLKAGQIELIGREP
jgi:hypothetical protein